MKFLFFELIKKINHIICSYTNKFYQLINESEQAHNKMIEESGWTRQEYFDALNKSRAALHKHF